MEEKPIIHQAINYYHTQSSEYDKNHHQDESITLINLNHKSKNINSKLSYFMIKVALSKTFDPKQFKLISSISPEIWIKNQKQMLKKINQSKKLKQKYFSLFLKNHTSISNWCKLATREKVDIQPYVFKDLFMQKKNENVVQQNFNNERLKQSIYHKKSQKKQTLNFVKYQQNRNSTISSKSGNDSNNYNQSENISFMKPTFMPIGLRKYEPRFTRQQKDTNKQLSPPNQTLSKQKQQLMGVFFNNMIELNLLQHKRKPLNLKLYKLKKKQDVDSHDLYMKTFDACNGRKYIFYDYEKHMKGLKQKTKYNHFLRNGAIQANVQHYIQQQNHPNTPKTKMNKYLQFEQFKAKQQQRDKCSLLPINIVLNQKELNNYKGLKKVVSENKSSKVVFVNHQGKPITYYIKQETNKIKSKNSWENAQSMLNQRNSSHAQQLNDSKQMMKVSNSMTIR